MSEMVERVARAIGKTLYGAHCEPTSPRGWDVAMDAARAAIEAMRKPTNEMENSGTRVLAVDWELCADGRIAPEIWDAMIASALDGKLHGRRKEAQAPPG